VVLLLRLFQHFHELKSLEACNCSRRGGQSWNDTTGLQFDLDPVHQVELVARSSAVTHGMHQIYVEVAVLVFLEFLWLDDDVFEGLTRLRLANCCKKLDKLLLQLVNVID